MSELSIYQNYMYHNL